MTPAELAVLLKLASAVGGFTWARDLTSEDENRLVLLRMSGMVQGWRGQGWELTTLGEEYLHDNSRS